MSWKLLEIRAKGGMGKDTDFIFGDGDKRLIVEWWRSIDRFYFKPKPAHITVQRATPRMIEAVHAGMAFVELTGNLGDFPEQDLL